MYSHLILSGGGVKGITMLGALLCLEHNDKLNNLTNIGGTSIGALIGSLLCIMKPSEIQYKIQDMFVFKESDINIKNIFTNFGLIEENHLVSFVGNLFTLKLGKTPTMKELFDFSKIELDIYATNISKQQLEKFNYKTEPDLLISDAVKMTINLPILFTKIEYKKSLYVDGGIIENFPWRNYETININKKIGIDLTSEKNETEITKLNEYIYNILYSMWSQGFCTETDGVLKLYEDCSVFHFNMTNEIISKKLHNGYEKMSVYLKKRV